MGLNLLVLLGVFVSILWGGRFGHIATILILATIATIGTLICLQLIPLNVDFNAYSTSPISWLTAILTAGTFLFVIVISSTRIHSTLLDSVKQTQHRAAELQESNEKLRTEIKERENAERQLRSVQKMKALGQLAGGVAHDFNNILQVIQGFNELAWRRSSPDSSVRAYLHEVRESVRKATALTQQLSTFSRKESLYRKHLNLNDIICTTTSLLKRLLGEHVDLKLNLDSELHPIKADAGQLEQVLMNLCLNARDAMIEGGQLAISTQNADLDEDFCNIHPWAQPGEYVVLSVSDNGIGISQDMRERIFEPFFTTKEVGKGTGLGLATVQAVVDRHDGSIDVISKPGDGAEFIVHLPAAGEEVVIKEIHTEPEQAQGGMETVLLAEDDEQVRHFTVEVLANAGYNVITARDGEEAILLFEQNKDQIDAAILDVIMPKTTGKGVYEATKSIKPDIKVLFCSGYSANTLEDGSLLHQRAPLLRKPFSADDLLRNIRNVLDTPNLP
ncbi:MAG: response regulator [Proteobacteria bacterium]|nr:response regulator [Pseudomonadota bacterium]